MKDVLITVVSQKGHCGYGHAEGHSWTFNGTTPAGFCANAWCAIYPTVRALAAGGTFPWAAADGSLDLVCQDAANPVVFRLKPLG